MKERQAWWIAIAMAILLVSPGIVHGQQIIQIRTGQSGGAPGVCPSPDDCFTYNPVSTPGCALPFRTAPFTAADFAATVAGPPALITNGAPPWLPALPSDPLARWITWQPIQNCQYGQSTSMLYACRFFVDGSCPTGDIRVCWAADDGIGDAVYGGPNPIGIYINGTPLTPAFSGGNYGAETCAVQTGIPLNSGWNYFYAYQRDAGCAVAGLILSARMVVTTGLCPSILVTKFDDQNGNGIQDGGEPGLPGWTFNLSGPVNLTGTTGAGGTYFFNCVPAGTYTVKEVTQPGWIVTTPPGGVATLTVDCGQDYAVNFGNRRCDQGQTPCVPLPICLTAWWPLDECAGITANEVVANRDGAIIGGVSNPTWGAGRWGSPCGLNIPGTPGTSVVQMNDYPEHDLGTGSFTIFAWVRTTTTDGTVKTIVDKREPPFLTPKGYLLYHSNGQLAFQYNNGVGAPVTHYSTAPPFNDGQWHTVAVSVCRNPANPASNVARLYVDSFFDVFAAASVEAGNLSNSAGLLFGDQCPGFVPGVPFAGAIDDVQIYKCCLTSAQIATLRTDLAYCHDTCYVPSIKGTPFGSTTTTLTLCNYSLTAQTYTWTIAGLPSGPGCSVNGPTVFTPASGTVTIPAATSGPSCVSIPISVVLPAGMTVGQTTCYEVTTANLTGKRCCVTRGRIRKTGIIHVTADPAIYDAAVGTPVPVTFKIHNDSDTAFAFDYSVVGRSSDGDPLNEAVRLNGLPPGQPYFGTLMVLPMDSIDIVLDAELMEFQPLNLNEVVISGGDLDGDGVPDDLACLALRSIPESSVADAPDAPESATAVVARGALTAYPNPFSRQTGISLYLATTQSRVRVEVFDVGGRLVRSIYEGTLESGTHLFAWDGRDDKGRDSGHGIYFLRARSSGIGLQMKLIRLE